ncbi:MAG: protein-L-isoaspartate(D-aspartate) O-methyltransferase [Bacteroidota bacterium]|nr:protein-L-isoaspartate(D-aspartate) O-methyltransferase [Bacteroidota bacterium]
MKEIDYTLQRKEMVDWQIKGRGIHTTDILEVFMQIPRHIFVPEELRYQSYEDCPLPIGFDQTISQPYIVAYMTEALKPDKNKRVLEIGTGSGYQAAILSCLCKEVFSIEINASLGEQTKKLLKETGYSNINLKTGDGYKGWKEFAPFDMIIVTCAPSAVPEALLEQLAERGKMIIPIGSSYNQRLYLIEKINGQNKQTAMLHVRFVPMIHKN